jgi:hypothetical protein
MKYITHVQTIQKYLVDRVSLEQELALALSSEFKTGDLFWRMNTAVWASFIFLNGLKSEPALKSIIDRLEQQNSFLFHTDPKTVEGVLETLVRGLFLSAEQCGNLIRFYGEVVDACGSQSIYWRKERAKQIAWRYGGGGEAFKASRNSQYVAQADRGSVWRKTDTPNKVGGRIRVKAGNFFTNGANPYYDLIPGNLFDKPDLKALHVGKKFGGVMVWKIEDTSTVGKIDRTFGLPFGADISGTTTDNLYFLTGWADISKGDPIVMMLPLAAIVGEYHHSLLEVAAAMSLRKVISYSIGFYTTLLPSLPQGIAPLRQRSNVITLLQRLENDKRNQRILLHYDKNQKIAGCFIAEDEELEQFKKLATIDIRLWPKFNSFPPYPGEDKVMELLAEAGLANAALASKRDALRDEDAAAEMERKRLERRLGRRIVG